MSHCAVLVIGDDVEDQLAPYHEFECTGTDDQYVQTINITEEHRKRYETGTTTRWRSRSGRLYQEHKDDCKAVKVPVKEIYSFREYCEKYCKISILKASENPDLEKKHKYGWCRVDANGKVMEVVDRTNPAAKWDWYEVGGRWDGFFTLKKGVVSEANEENNIAANRKANIEPQALDLLTKAFEGTDLTLLEVDSRNNGPNTSNRCLKRNIDIDSMRKAAAEEARCYWRKCAEVIRGETWIPWADILKRPDYMARINHYRDFYWSQPPIARLQKAELLPIWNPKPDVFLEMSEEEYVEDEINGVCAPYAFVRDSIWTGMGEMGWWGMSRGEMPSREWHKRFRDMFDALPDDTLLTLVDCHI